MPDSESLADNEHVSGRWQISFQRSQFWHIWSGLNTCHKYWVAATMISKWWGQQESWGAVHFVAWEKLITTFNEQMIKTFHSKSSLCTENTENSGKHKEHEIYLWYQYFMIVLINILVYEWFGLLFFRKMRMWQMTITAEGKSKEAIHNSKIFDKCCLS